MDDDLAQPSATQNIPNASEDVAEDVSSGDEDTGLDWAAVAGAAGASSRSTLSIPKRGEKDFQPREGGSGLQTHNLDRSRNAMFDVLRVERNTNR
jgi:tRNA-splicing endonuclease subunit Sen54